MENYFSVCKITPIQKFSQGLFMLFLVDFQTREKPTPLILPDN